MTCEELLRGLSEYLDAEMRREICAEVEAHMAACPGCRFQVNSLNGTVALVRSLGGGCGTEVVLRLRSTILNSRAGNAGLPS